MAPPLGQKAGHQLLEDLRVHVCLQRQQVKFLVLLNGVVAGLDEAVLGVKALAAQALLIISRRLVRALSTQGD